MEQDGIHGLTAAYALHALDEADEREYEAHLSACPRCRDELASLTEASASLAFAVESPAPPAALRERILDAARADRSNVIPLRPRRWTGAVSAVAAAAAVVAVALGAWAFSLRSELDDTREALERQHDAAAVLADPSARSVSLSGADGRLVVAPDGPAALVVSGLDPAPSGHGYEMWVIRRGEPRSAGTFRVEDGRVVVRLRRDVPRGSTVAVTLEPEDGTAAPEGSALFTAAA
jgi:anti-sigma factor RsiW